MDLITAIASLALSPAGATPEFDPTRLAAMDLDAAFFAGPVLTAVLVAVFFSGTGFPPDFAEDRAFAAEGRVAAIFDVALTSGRDLAAFAFAASVFAGIALAITAVFFAKPDFRGADPAFVTLVASWPLVDTDFPAAGFACRSLAPPDLLGDTLDLDTD